MCLSDQGHWPVVVELQTYPEKITNLYGTVEFSDCWTPLYHTDTTHKEEKGHAEKRTKRFLE